MKKLHIVTLALVALLALVSTSAFGATGTISSTVTIECAAAVTGGSPLVFGLLSAPTNGFPDVWVLSALDGSLTHTGGNGMDFVLDDHSKGNFTLTGSEPITFTLSVQTDFPDAFLTLSAITAEVTGAVDPSPTTHECLTSSPIAVGGTLTVLEGAAAGGHTASILITANY